MPKSNRQFRVDLLLETDDKDSFTDISDESIMYYIKDALSNSNFKILATLYFSKVSENK